MKNMAKGLLFVILACGGPARAAAELLSAPAVSTAAAAAALPAGAAAPKAEGRAPSPAPAPASRPVNGDQAAKGADRRSGITRVVSGWLLSGQSVTGGGSTFTGSASMLAAFSVPVGSEWKVMPLYQGSYETTRQEVDAGQGKRLVSQRMDHRFSGKLVWGPETSPHRLKLNVGYRAEFSKEAKNEAWGRGLFDYRKPSAGLEWEYLYREPYSVRLGYDYFEISFPNFATLESQGVLSVNGKSVAREFAGGRVLDSRNHSFLAAANGRLPLWAVAWEGSYSLTLQGYPEQPVVDSEGLLDAEKRADETHSLNLSLRKAWKLRFPHKIEAGLRGGTARVSSNQNSFDAFADRFFPGFYDYRELRFGAQGTVHFSRPRLKEKTIRWSLSVDAAQRAYPNRVVQDETGTYLSGGIGTLSTTWATTLSWPLSEKLSLMGTVKRTDSASNMRFERFYRYNYSSLYYLFGLGWEL